MSNTSGGTSFLNAFFTSTSASCVTGLIIVDTAAYWTFKGQMVILILVQIGGVSILTFATFFATFVAKGVGAKQQSLLRDFFSSESISDARSILRNIIFISLAIELIGAVLIYLSFGNDVRFESTGHKIYQSIFHSVSAFNNSGFSIFTDGLYHTDLRSAYPFHFVIGILVFLGAIGFPFLQEYISWKRIRERQKIRWKRINIAARIAIGTAVGLTLITAILTFLLERNYALEGENFISQFCLVMFQAIDRTAGFSTMNAGDLRTPTLIIFCITMFIGSASGSTGGGIRTSTFAVLFLAGFSILRGKNKVEIFNNTLSQDLIYKSFTIFLFTVFFEMIMVFLLTITDAEHDLMAIIFEVVSAFATMGRSTGITPELSEIGKYLIILSMFVGRIGTITLIVALSSRSADAKYKYPSAQFMVG